jgi:hypothetical protein
MYLRKCQVRKKLGPQIANMEIVKNVWTANPQIPTFAVGSQI